MSFAQLLFVTAPKCFRYRLGEIIFLSFFLCINGLTRAAEHHGTQHVRNRWVDPVRLQGKDHSQNPSAIT